MIGKLLREFVAMDDVLPYLESVVSVWNLLGRRDNKYKARIKITIHENGLDEFSRLVDERFALIRPSFQGFDQTLLSEISDAFIVPKFQRFDLSAFDARFLSDPNFRSWVDTNITAHKQADYAIATISLKSHGETPGDASSAQMRRIADLAETYSHDELRISHEQNIVLPHVHKAHLPNIYDALRDIGLATANIGLISDIIACPGMDYCALATARSIPIAQDIATHFDALKLEHDIGPLKIKISGCINACGHHHVGHIGILGLDRAGVENYQITLGGDGTETPAIGERAGPGFGADKVIPAIERLIHFYLNERLAPSETFLECYRRLGLGPFKAALYETEHSKVPANAA
jgi:sulfite reductase (NADPH) hemoprotein beta-component